jgi:transcriptional regulator with XRE-family HTH domain
MMHLSNTNKNWNTLSNTGILREIGEMIRAIRLKRNVTQEQLAERAGVDRTTIVQLEKGRSATLLTFIQILRVLEKLELLNGLLEEAEVSPLEAVKVMKKTRQRASRQPNPAQRKKSTW